VFARRIRRSKGQIVFPSRLDARIQAIRRREALRALSKPRRGGPWSIPNNGKHSWRWPSVFHSFDPEYFHTEHQGEGIGKALQKDEEGRSISLNRAISCLPPGSTFKLITALARSAARATKNHSQAPNTAAVAV